MQYMESSRYAEWTCLGTVAPECQGAALVPLAWLKEPWKVFKMIRGYRQNRNENG